MRLFASTIVIVLIALNPDGTPSGEEIRQEAPPFITQMDTCKLFVSKLEENTNLRISRETKTGHRVRAECRET